MGRASVGEKLSFVFLTGKSRLGERKEFVFSNIASGSRRRIRRRVFVFSESFICLFYGVFEGGRIDRGILWF